jgi:Flp pilus assembly protein TadG
MIFRKLLEDRTAASAAEFALVLPLLLVFLFGIIDAGRWMWTYNQAEKATQMGARLAVVTTPVSSSLGASYIGACDTPLTQGDLIPANCFSTITCTSSSCSSGTQDVDAFNRILARMQLFLPQLTAANLTVEYSASGLGYAGNPNGPDISPLVTVKIGSPATPLQFTPITSFLLTSMNMPGFTTTLTAEDLSGAQSN